jgi:hypothetical protein
MNNNVFLQARRHQDLKALLCTNNVINLCIIFIRTCWFELKIPQLFWLEIFLGLVLILNMIILTSPEVFDNLNYIVSYFMTLLWGFVALMIFGDLLYVSAIMTVMIFSLFLYFGYFMTRQQHLEQQIFVYQSPNIVQRSHLVIENITRRVVDLTSNNNEEQSCSICLEKFNIEKYQAESEENQTIVELIVCNHRYHIHCLELWLRVNRSCPLCRIEL